MRSRPVLFLANRSISVLREWSPNKMEHNPTDDELVTSIVNVLAVVIVPPVPLSHCVDNKLIMQPVLSRYQNIFEGL